MLAERTDEHLQLFEEGKEAEFFCGSSEMLDKIKHYLRYEGRRKTIAERGWERCLKSGYSNQDRMKQMMSTVEVLAKEETSRCS
jgi:spore maturation protein CgeB